MKTKIKLILGVFIATLISANFVAPASALSSAGTFGTFSLEGSEDDNQAILQAGKNTLLFGNNLNEKVQAEKGLLFAFANQATLQGKSEYSFIAGNAIIYNGETEKDLFIAGNVIRIADTAKIGRDVFVAGNNIDLDKVDLAGNFSVTGNKVIIRNAKISGDVNLAVDRAVFEGEVVVSGKLVINEDAEVTGASNLTYSEIEKYEIVHREVTATEILVAKIFSLAGLFITFVILVALFPGVKRRMSHQLTATKFGKNLVIGLCAFALLPIICIFMLISFIAAPAGIILLVLYLIMLYLAQIFSGYWLGRIIFEKCFRREINVFVEGFVGIVIIVGLGMLPGFSNFVWVLSTLLGMGLILQIVNPRGTNPEPVAKNAPVKSPSKVMKAKPSASTKSKSTQKTKKEK